MRKNLYFTVVLVKIFLRTNPKCIRTFVWLVIYVIYGFTKNLLGFQEKKKIIIMMMFGFVVLVKS